MVILDPQNSTGIAFKCFTYQLVLGGWGVRISEVEGIAQKCILFTQPVIKSIFNLWGWQMIQLKMVRVRIFHRFLGQFGPIFRGFDSLAGFVSGGPLQSPTSPFHPSTIGMSPRIQKLLEVKPLFSDASESTEEFLTFFWIYRWYRLVIYAMTPKSVVRAANSLTKGNLN